MEITFGLSAGSLYAAVALVIDEDGPAAFVITLRDDV